MQTSIKWEIVLQLVCFVRLINSLLEVTKTTTITTCCIQRLMQRFAIIELLNANLTQEPFLFVIPQQVAKSKTSDKTTNFRNLFEA